jgi:8-oxo-dGTP diphosphatase
MASATRPLDIEQWVAASCHSAPELEHAARIGVDFAVLSPVAATVSHPGAQPLGWGRFRELVAAVPFPVYALGGMQLPDLATARAHGAQGIALMRGIWDAPEAERLVRECLER